MKTKVIILSSLLALASFGDNIKLGDYTIFGAEETCNENIAIGDGALAFSSNVYGTVAIGYGELRKRPYNINTTSINGEQLWISEPANAFSICPKKNDDFTNSPIWFKEGELHLNAKKIYMYGEQSGFDGMPRFNSENTYTSFTNDFVYEDTYVDSGHNLKRRAVLSSFTNSVYRYGGIVTGIVANCHCKLTIEYWQVNTNRFRTSEGDISFNVKVGDDGRVIDGESYFSEISSYPYAYARLQTELSAEEGMYYYHFDFNDNIVGYFGNLEMELGYGGNNYRSGVNQVDEYPNELGTNSVVKSSGVVKFLNDRIGSTNTISRLNNATETNGSASDVRTSRFINAISTYETIYPALLASNIVVRTSSDERGFINAGGACLPTSVDLEFDYFVSEGVMSHFRVRKSLEYDEAGGNVYTSFQPITFYVVGPWGYARECYLTVSTTIFAEESEYGYSYCSFTVSVPNVGQKGYCLKGITGHSRTSNVANIPYDGVVSNACLASTQFVIDALGGCTFGFDGGQFCVYTNGFKAGTLQFTPAP